jgi:hypothetical protein
MASIRIRPVAMVGVMGLKAVGFFLAMNVLFSCRYHTEKTT